MGLIQHAGDSDPAGADLAVRYAMYRSAGVGGDAAGASIILSWFFTTGIRLVIPAVALVLLVANGTDDDTTVTITIIAASALLGLGLFVFLVLYRETIAFRIGAAIQRWYNALLAGRWNLKELSGTAERMVEFRAQIIAGLRDRWWAALSVTLLNQAIFFLMLAMPLRFVGVTAEQASLEVIFDAHAAVFL